MDRKQIQDYIKIFDDAMAMRKERSRPSGAFAKSSLYYRGYDPAFHRYTVYNGERTVAMFKKSLCMGKKVCEDWASLLWSDKLDIACKGDKPKIVSRLVDMGFWFVGGKSVELAFGIGVSAIAVNVSGELDEQNDLVPETAKVYLSYYDAMNFVPLSYDLGEVDEAAFFTASGSKTKMTAYVRNEEGNYIIVCVEKDSKDGKKDKQYVIDTKSPVRMFCELHPNVVDNQSADFHGYPSIIGNCVSTLQAIDNAYDGMDNEITMGKKRIFASAKLNKVIFSKTEDGSVSREVRTFDPNDTVIYSLGEIETPDGKPFLWSPNDPLRIDQYSTNLTFNLQILSQQVGLGANYYRFDGGRIMTATQVVSQNSDTYRNVKKHEQVLEKSIKQLFAGICYATRLFLGDNTFPEDGQCEVIFDDSIIEDRQTEKASDEKDLAAGVISRSEFRQRWKGETKEQADKAVSLIMGDEEVVSRFNALAPVYASGLLTTKLAASLLFDGKEDVLKKAGYASVEDYIEDVENAKKQSMITADDLLGIRTDGGDKGQPKPEEEPKEPTAPEAK